jgi:hypothetical protein
MPATPLEELPTTESGSIRKKDAMKWMQSLGEGNDDGLLRSVVPKPKGHEGSTFPTPISTIRVTGTDGFITQIAKLLKPLLVYEGSATHIELNVKQVKDRETEALTDNYALYFSVAERGTEAGMMQALVGSHTDTDQQLLDASEGEA